MSWVTVELFSYLKKTDKNLSESKISVSKLGDLLDIISDGTISNRVAKDIFEEYLKSEKMQETSYQKKVWFKYLIPMS